MSFCDLVVAGLMAIGPAPHAGPPAPSRDSLAEMAAKRFPQPVRVGDVVKRDVLEPMESQPTIGRIRSLVKRGDGHVDAVVDFAGTVRFCTRPIAVPVEAIALVGYDAEVPDLKPDQLRQFETDDGAGATPLPPDAVLDLALVGPSH